MYNIMEEEVYEFQPAELPDEPRFCPQAQFNDKPDSLFFNDGVRKIDFVMVHEDEDRKDFDKRHTYQRHKVAFVHAAFVTFVSMATQTFSTVCRCSRWIFFLDFSIWEFLFAAGSCVMLWMAPAHTLHTPADPFNPFKVSALLSTTNCVYYMNE